MAGAGQEAAGVAEPAGTAGTQVLHVTERKLFRAQTAGSIEGVPGAAGEEGACLPEIKKIGKKNFAAVYIPATEKEKLAGKCGHVVRLSDQEIVVLRTYLTTHDYEATAKEAGITVKSVKRMLRRPALKAVVHEAILKETISEGMDKGWEMKELRLVWEGEKKPSASQMQAIKQIGEILRPRGPGTVVQQNNINSVYSGKSREVIDADWADARRTAA
jgi:hypothetical protein